MKFDVIEWISGYLVSLVMIVKARAARDIDLKLTKLMNLFVGEDVIRRIELDSNENGNSMKVGLTHIDYNEQSGFYLSCYVIHCGGYANAACN